jgi:hypothetical protein
MPAKIKMFITNGNTIPIHARSINKTALTTTRAPSALNTSIIGRIHSAKAGCGSCGRH